MAVPLGDSSFVDSVDASKRSPFVTHQGRSVLLSPTYAYVSQEQNWSLGLSLPVSFQVTSVSEIYTVNDQQYARIRAGIRPNVGYEIGARKSWDETTASVSYRSSTRSKATGEISGQLPLPGLGAMNIYAHGVAAYAFTPQQVLAQMALPLAESVDWGLSLKWLDSSKTPPPFLVIDKAQPLFTVPAPNWKLRDTWQPATALSFKIADRTSLVTSYRWVPTPLKNPQVGFYDRDAHEVALGVGVGVDAFFDQVTVVGRGRFLQGGGAYAWVGLGLGGQL
jgi:long-subunit fatty acid transport protein